MVSMHGICPVANVCAMRVKALTARKDDTWKDSDRCPNDCRGSHAARSAGQYGLCLMGQCYCYPGFTGPSCQEVLPLRCPRDCSNREFVVTVNVSATWGTLEKHVN